MENQHDYKNKGVRYPTLPNIIMLIRDPG